MLSTAPTENRANYSELVLPSSIKRSSLHKSSGVTAGVIAAKINWILHMYLFKNCN